MSFLNPIEDIIKPIVDPIIMIAKSFVVIGEFILYILKMIPLLVTSIIEIFTPNKFLNDLIGGTFAAFGIIYKSIFSSLTPSNLFSKIPKQKNPPRGIMALHKQKGPDGKYLPSNKSSDRKCFPPTFARLFMMVLCPPFALFLHVGISRWYYIVLCTLLTIYGYYFPGLIYAALHILC